PRPDDTSGPPHCSRARRLALLRTSRPGRMPVHIAMPGGFAIPARRFGVVLRHALAGVVERAQVELRVRIALVGGPAVPACRLRVVFGHALAAIVQKSEIVRRLCVPLSGGLAEPAYGFGAVLAN